jgi:hypothetical protein
MWQQLKKCKNTFYCPSGHAQSYSKSKEDELRETLTERNRKIELLRADNEAYRARVIKAEEKLKKLEKPHGAKPKAKASS